MKSVYVIGVGMTPFGKLLDHSVKDLTAQSVNAALRDAGLQATDLDAAFFANCVQGHMEGQHMIRGQIALRAMGIEGIPVSNIESACTSGSTALRLAMDSVLAGSSQIALAVGAEKMYSTDRARMFSAFNSGWDIYRTEETTAELLKLGRELEVPPGTTSPNPYSIFMDIYAAKARDHMQRYGTTQAHLAAIASKNHVHSQFNPLSQYRKPFSVEEILQAAPITYPLTSLMCSPISDGGAAVIVCGEEAFARLQLPRTRAVKVLACVLRTGATRDVKNRELACTTLASRQAYEIAGIGPQDVSVAEVHDATAMGELVQTENLGFCEWGAGGFIAARGETSLGGRIPVNPSGGLESKGHPIGATGLAQIHELVCQLRGEAGQRQVENARLALAENGGGLIGLDEAAACVTILAR